MQALNNKPITIYGDGFQTRSFCYVDDLIDGLIKFMNSANEVTGPVNLGNPNEFTMIELANKVVELTFSESEIIFEPLPQDDPKQRQPDINLAKDLLGWQPTVELSDGLSTTINYFQSIIKA